MISEAEERRRSAVSFRPEDVRLEMKPTLPLRPDPAPPSPRKLLVRWWDVVVNRVAVASVTVDVFMLVVSVYAIKWIVCLLLSEFVQYYGMLVTGEGQGQVIT